MKERTRNNNMLLLGLELPLRLNIVRLLLLTGLGIAILSSLQKDAKMLVPKILDIIPQNVTNVKQRMGQDDVVVETEKNQELLEATVKGENETETIVVPQSVTGNEPAVKQQRMREDEVVETEKNQELLEARVKSENETESVVVIDTTTERRQPPPPQSHPIPVRLLRNPKAGSSSFSAFLRLEYNCTSAQHPPGDCTGQNRASCAAVQECSNHKAPPDWSNPGIADMITFVRDPVSRYVSAYGYEGHHGKGTGSNITKHTVLFPEYDNTQTNFLSRRTIGTWAKRNGNKGRSVPPNATLLPSDNEMKNRLEYAVDLLSSDKLKFVGLVEHWNDSLRLFCRMHICSHLEQSLHAKRQRQQTARGQESYPYSDPVAMDAVTSSNAVDQQLYQAAVRRFCQDLALYQDDAAFTASLQDETVELCAEANTIHIARRYHNPRDKP
jgi:hypothetical protein